MGPFGKRKRRQQGRSEDDLTSLSQAGGDALAVYGSGGDFDMRRMVDELFSVDLLYSVQQLRDVVGVTADQFYDGVMLNQQWDGQDESSRRQRLEQDAAYANRLDQAEYDDDQFDVVKLHQSVKLKVHVLAIGCDALYGTDYVQRLYEDPLPFGVFTPGDN